MTAYVLVLPFVLLLLVHILEQSFVTVVLSDLSHEARALRADRSGAKGADGR